MKKYTVLIILLFLLGNKKAFSQVDSIPAPGATVVIPIDTLWRSDAAFGINFSNVGLNNWSGGGQNAMSFTGVFVAGLHYKHEGLEWHNLLDMAYGFQRLGTNSAPFRKSDDRIYFQTKLSYDQMPKWKYTAMADFRSQFAEGYKYYDEITRDSSVLISNFLAPAYVAVSMGMEYLPIKNMTLLLSPFTTKITIVNNTYLSNLGAYGVTPGKKFRDEYGVSFMFKYKADLMKNVSFATQLSLFDNYKNLNVDVFWDTFLYLKINSFLTTTFTTNLIYDDDIHVLRDNGTSGPAIQFKNVLAVGLVYKLYGYGVR